MMFKCEMKFGKTSALSGVYFTQDDIIHAAKPPKPTGASASSAQAINTDALEEENRRLREELERIKRGEN